MRFNESMERYMEELRRRKGKEEIDWNYNLKNKQKVDFLKMHAREFP